MAKVVTIDSIENSIKDIKKDDVLIFPTDTVYGIGASIESEESIEKVYAAKKRPEDKPLAVLCASIEQIKPLIKDYNDKIDILIKTFMPGPLTIITEKADCVSDKITRGLSTIGVRIPNHETAIKILNKIGPMATSSVNYSGDEPLNNSQDIIDVFIDDVDYIFEGKVNHGISSTIVQISNNGIKILREGIISRLDIEKVLKK